MGRKPKAGLNYFICDVGWMEDTKFRRLRQKYGYLAPYTYQILLTMIYKDKGYYIDASNIEELSLDILEYLQGKYMPSAETVGGLIADLVACRLFSRDLYETEQILTSRRIQEEYYNSTAKRVAVQVDKRYWILSVDDMKSISSRSSILSLFISDGRNSVSDGRNDVSDGRSTQIREERNPIQKEGILSDPIIRGGISEMSKDVMVICNHFSSCFGTDASRNLAKQAEKFLRAGMTVDSMKSTITSAARKKPPNPIAFVIAGWKAINELNQPVHIDPKDMPLEDWEQDWLQEFQAMKDKEETNDT